MGFHYYMPTRILFGAGSVKKLAKTRLPGKKALLITGGSSTTKLGYVDLVRALLTEAGADSVLYDGVQPNPTIDSVRACAALAREEGCDFVVGLGGGSSIDTAKAAAVAAVNPGDYWDYVYGGTGGCKRMEHDPLPLIAITTTAGTGTEADPWMVVTNGEEKIGSGGDRTFPTLSIVDPELMATVPPRMTAYQGFDALFHAVEGYIATIASPITDMYALRSIELIGRSLPRAVADGMDMDARADVALANTLSGFVESMSSCVSEHSIEHALSAYHPNLTHGAGLIMLSLAYFETFLGVCDARFIDMARALGKTDANRAEDFLEALADLQRACGVDGLRMSEYGISEEKFGDYADNARATMGGLFKLDRKQLSREDVIDILRRSYR